MRIGFMPFLGGRNQITSLHSGFARTPQRRRAQAKIDTNPTGYVLIAIDISKNRHDILIAAPGKKCRGREILMNRFEDYRRLIDIVRDCGCPVRIGFEATGNYHRTLVYQLAMAGFELQLISSIAIASTREAHRRKLTANENKTTEISLTKIRSE